MSKYATYALWYRFQKYASKTNTRLYPGSFSIHTSRFTSGNNKSVLYFLEEPESCKVVRGKKKAREIEFDRVVDYEEGRELSETQMKSQKLFEKKFKRMKEKTEALFAENHEGCWRFEGSRGMDCDLLPESKDKVFLEARPRKRRKTEDSEGGASGESERFLGDLSEGLAGSKTLEKSIIGDLSEGLAGSKPLEDSLFEAFFEKLAGSDISFSEEGVDFKDLPAGIGFKSGGETTMKTLLKGEVLGGVMSLNGKGGEKVCDEGGRSGGDVFLQKVRMNNSMDENWNTAISLLEKMREGEEKGKNVLNPEEDAFFEDFFKQICGEESNVQSCGEKENGVKKSIVGYVEATIFQMVSDLFEGDE